MTSIVYLERETSAGFPAEFSAAAAIETPQASESINKAANAKRMRIHSKRGPEV
jgi:hypothetical protein